MEHPDSTPPDETVLSAQVVERLLRFDELSQEELTELETNPAARDELHRLQLAEAWLTEPFSSEGADESSCPSPEVLFDFGQKLEPMALSNSEQVKLSEHLDQCAECSALVATLAERPPSPLIVVDSTLPNGHRAPSPRPQGNRAVRIAQRPRSMERASLRNAPFLVAASLLAVLVLSGWPTSVLGKGPSQFPSPSVMRGSSSLTLISPRNLVLSRSRDLPGLPQPNGLIFEARPFPGAASYEFKVFERNGSALQSDAERASRGLMTGAAPQLLLASPLPVGHYSWSATAVLETGERKPLGEMDFRVVADEALEDELMSLGESVDAVLRLDYGHYYADARTLTRRLRDVGACDADEAARYLQELDG